MSDWLEIHALADEQLCAEDKARVQERLAGCERSRRELEAVQNVKAALAARKDSETCAATWARCRGRLDELERAGKIEGFIGRYAWALCSLLLVMIVGAGLLNRISGKPALGASEVPNMAASLAPYLSSPRSQSPSDVAEFENRAIGRAPLRVSESQGSGDIQVVRGGSMTIDGRHYVRIDLLDSGSPVSLFAIEGANVVGVEPVEGREGLGQGVINGRNCVAWSQGEYSVMLVGEEPVDELCDLADRVSSP